MSTALAIASVTAVLKDLLDNGVIDQNLAALVGEVVVSALPPDRIETLNPPADQKSRLNLFLYQVTPNAGWRNVGFPSRDGHGERVSNPPLALDLHYLLTAYSTEEFHTEILLGYGMQLLHETPVLTRAAIRTSLAPPTPLESDGNLSPAEQALFTSELAEQLEQIKISPQSLSAEELSKLWPAFGAKYRPTAAYQASVVLIESRRSIKSALPVRDRTIHVTPFRQPIIEQIRSQASSSGPIVSDQPVLAGYNLVIVGKQLRGEDTVVSVGGIEVTPADLDVSDTQIKIPIPSTLPAGVQGVQVVQRTLIGEPPTPHRGVESNVAAFVLRPKIIDPVGLSNPHGTGNAPRSANVDINIRPAIGEAQRAILLLNEFQPPSGSPPEPVESPALAYSFSVFSRQQLSPPPSPPESTTSITFAISGVRAGTYLLRLQVDGAESPLGSDAAGQYNSPLVTIP